MASSSSIWVRSEGLSKMPRVFMLQTSFWRLSTCTRRTFCTEISSQRTCLWAQMVTSDWLTLAWVKRIFRAQRMLTVCAVPPSTWVLRSCRDRAMARPLTGGRSVLLFMRCLLVFLLSTTKIVTSFTRILNTKSQTYSLIFCHWQLATFAVVYWIRTLWRDLEQVPSTLRKLNRTSGSRKSIGQKLKTKCWTPPYKPQLDSMEDVKHFPPEFTKQKLSPTDMESQNAKSANAFGGFSYEKGNSQTDAF